MKTDFEIILENAGLNEYVENISDKNLPVIITDDNSKARESILNCGNGKRWLYDRKKRFWIIGHSGEYIHQDMTVLAARNGFYPEFGRNIEREVSYFYDEDYMRENPYLIRGAVVSFNGKIEEVTKSQIKSLLFDDYTAFILVQVNEDSGVILMMRDDPEPIIKKLRLKNVKVLYRKELYDLDESLNESNTINLSDWDKFVSMIGHRHLIDNKLMYYAADGKIINITPLGNVYITQKNDLKRRAFSDAKSFDEIYKVLKEKNLLPETVEPKEKSFEEKLNALFEKVGKII